MKVLVAGIDSTNHNYRKIKGFVDAFSSRFSTKHTLGDVISVSKELQETSYDVAFGEFERPDTLDMSKIKNFVMWGNLDITKFREIARKNPNTNFVLAPKSVMHVKEASDIYTRAFGREYQVSGEEGQDLKQLSHVLESSTLLGDSIYKIDENLVYTFVPCSLSQKSEPLEAEFDICYFGTLGNRPKVAAVLAELSSRGYRIKSTFDSGFIHPEVCVELYRRSICNITQQVHPVILEHPVRLGESTACGCATFVLDAIVTSSHGDPLVPNFMVPTSIESIENYIKSNAGITARQQIVDSFTSTYDNAVDRILKAISVMEN